MVGCQGRELGHAAWVGGMELQSLPCQSEADRPAELFPPKILPGIKLVGYLSFGYPFVIVML